MEFLILPKLKFTREEKRMKFHSYHLFIKSDWWGKQKLHWYSRHKKRCAKCKVTNNIHLHHKRYPKQRRFLSLSDNDFVALCGKCHKSYHYLYGVKQNMMSTSTRFIKQRK